MSLKDPDDDLDELVPQKNNFLSKTFNKYKIYLLLLVIGLVLGAIIQFTYINPILNQSTEGACLDCINTKQLLNNENDCLYTLLPDPKTASEKCAARNYVDKQQTTPKDYNEEA